MASLRPPVVLFGYDSSAFTQKIRMALKLRQIAYHFVTVPSMMPRPLLRKAFNLTYRKIPVLVIGRDVYCDTSLIVEALEAVFPATLKHPSLYPSAADGRDYRPLMRGFASYWTDRSLFRVTTGLIPSSVWRSNFGVDRAGLIGHKLDAAKLEAKLPRNLANLDLHLSILEPLFRRSRDDAGPWIFSTPSPSIADLALYYQLDWAIDISAGKGLSNLTGDEISDTDNSDFIRTVFNKHRYPALCSWFDSTREYLENLPPTEALRAKDSAEIIEALRSWTPDSESNGQTLLATPNPVLETLERQNGLSVGAMVVVAPDDTGRDDPTVGELVAISPEEIVIKPNELESGDAYALNVCVHFPRVGFVVRPYQNSTKI